MPVEIPASAVKRPKGQGRSAIPPPIWPPPPPPYATEEGTPGGEPHGASTPHGSSSDAPMSPFSPLSPLSPDTLQALSPRTRNSRLGLTSPVVNSASMRRRRHLTTQLSGLTPEAQSEAATASADKAKSKRQHRFSVADWEGLQDSTKNLMERRLYGDSASVHDGPSQEERRRLEELEAAAKRRCVPLIHPDDKHRTMWNIAGCFFVIVCVILLPIEMAYFDPAPVSLFVINCVMDAFFVVDIVLNFRTGYWHDGELIMEPALIRTHYLKTAFFLDAVSTLPVDYVALALDGGAGGGGLLRAGKLTRVTKTVRVLRVSRLARLFRLPRLFRYGNKYKPAMNAGYVRILKLLFLLVLFSHWNACILFMVARYEGFPDGGWVQKRDLVIATAWEQYSWSLFKSFSHLLCIGYGEFAPSTLGETWVTLVSMTTGASLFALIIASITTVLLTLDSPTNDFTALLSGANKYMEYCNMQPDLRERIRSYLLTRWTPVDRTTGPYDMQSDSLRSTHVKEGTHRESSYAKFNETEILLQLSPALRRDIAMHNCGDVIRSIPLFGGLMMSPAVVTSISERLTPALFMKRDIIIEQDEPPNGMYFVKEGRVALLFDMKRMCNLEDKMYFGEMPLLFPAVKSQPFEAIATSFCVSTFELSTAHFELICATYPNMREPMQVVAKQRVEILKMSDVIVTTVDEARVDAELEMARMDGQERVKALEFLFADLKAKRRKEAVKRRRRRQSETAITSPAVFNPTPTPRPQPRTELALGSAAANIFIMAGTRRPSDDSQGSRDSPAARRGKKTTRRPSGDNQGSPAARGGEKTPSRHILEDKEAPPSRRASEELKPEGGAGLPGWSSEEKLETGTGGGVFSPSLERKGGPSPGRGGEDVMSS